ncbi:MAG TPA: hypothetical protein VGM07_00105 [Stellaceae bacterium]
MARQCVLDTLACTVAGAGDPLVGMLLDEWAEAGGAAQETARRVADNAPISVRQAKHPIHHGP